MKVRVGCLVLALASCASHRGALVTGGVGLSMATTGAALIGVAAHSGGGCSLYTGEQRDGCSYLAGGSLLILGGGIVGLVGLVNLIVPEHQRNPWSDQAAELAARGIAAANAGDCDTTSKLAPRILALDPDAYRTRFVSEPAVVRCLWQVKKREQATAH